MTFVEVPLSPIPVRSCLVCESGESYAVEGREPGSGPRFTGDGLELVGGALTGILAKKREGEVEAGFGLPLGL